MTADEARAAALRTFGNPALLRDQTRATWSWNWLESLMRDIRYATRGLVRAPGFAVIAILVMGLGIGANVALFTIVVPCCSSRCLTATPVNSSLSLKPTQTTPNAVPISLSRRAVSMSGNAPLATAPSMALVSPWQDYNVSAEGGKLPEKIDAAWCSWNFFSTLGVQPALGRSFTPDDDRAGATATVIITNSFWKLRYSGDPSIVGKTIWLDAKPYTVIGVLPSSFVYSSSFGGNTVQAWTRCTA